jgi:class 3 adenylate cyclase
MQESVKHYAEGVPQFRSADPDPRQFEVRRVVVRSIASDLQMYYTAVGQTTHVATLLEQMTMPGSVLISPEQRTKRPWPPLDGDINSLRPCGPRVSELIGRL